MPTWADVAGLFPTWHELFAGIVVNLVTQPVQWLIAFLLAFLIRQRRAEAASDTEQDEGQHPAAPGIVDRVLDGIMLVSAVAILGPITAALVFAAAAVSLALAIVVVVLAVAFFGAVMWWLWGLFSGRYDDPSAR